jgi:hypothetical protein
LVTQGFCQKEIHYEETFAPIAHLEAIITLLVFVASTFFKLFQMDVKSGFLNRYVEEKVYVRQPLGFEHPKFSNHVFKFQKALYSLKQAPRASYEHLKTFLLAKSFLMGYVNKTFFSSSKGMIPCRFRFMWMILYLVVLLLLLFPSVQLL